MPQRKPGIEELKKSHKRHMHNLDLKSDLKKTIKKYLTSIETKNTSEAQNILKEVYVKIDKAAKKKIIKKNTASRRKSRFARLLVNKAS